MQKNKFIDNLDLPVHYNNTRLTLIARDPYWVFAYWEIAPSVMDEESSYIIRMCDNANSSFDVNISPRANSWYINLPRDNANYYGRLGVIAADGKFSPLAVSNSISVPRVNPLPNKIPLTPPLKKGERGGLSRKVKRMFLTEDDVRTYYSKLMPLTNRKVKRRVEPKVGATRWVAQNRPAAAQNVSGPGVGAALVAAQNVLPVNNLLGSSEGLISSGGGASERYEKHRKFFFEIGTELIVYGRTEPDAEVRLNDKKVELRNDGTFSLRFALPDGKIPLDFVAISHDRVDKRAITTSVERAKTIFPPHASSRYMAVNTK